MAEKKRDPDDKKDVAGAVGGAFAGGAVGGVAGGAMAGAAAGGLGGPAGAAIGAAVGAVAGAMGGKAIADRIDPHEEDKYWQSTYSSRSYVSPGSTYDDYGPAYKLGYERYPDYHGRSFDDVEPEFERDWNSTRGNSRLEWSDARYATRDAFDRIRGSVGGATTMGNEGTADDLIDDINDVLRGELSAIETYRQALEEVRDDHGHDARYQQLARMQQDHEQAANELRSLVQQMGGTPSRDSGPWGTWSKTVMGTARILGDKSALSALASGEKSGVEDYQSAMKRDRTPDSVRHVYRLLMARSQEHLDQLERMIRET
jgi:rubrerythrin